MYDILVMNVYLKLMKKYIYSLLLWLIPFVGCTTDAGYDPSSEYRDKSVDYVVYAGRGNYRDGESLPDCNKRWEGYVFYVYLDDKAYVCVEGIWSKTRDIPRCDKEVLNAKMYEPKHNDDCDLKYYDYDDYSKAGCVYHDRDYNTYLEGCSDKKKDNGNYAY